LASHSPTWLAPCPFTPIVATRIFAMSRERPEPADDADSASAPTDVEAGMPANEAAASVSAVSTKSRREIGTEADSRKRLGWEGAGKGMATGPTSRSRKRPRHGARRIEFTLPPSPANCPKRQSSEKSSGVRANRRACSPPEVEWLWLRIGRDGWPPPFLPFAGGSQLCWAAK